MYYTDGDLEHSLELCAQVAPESHVGDCRNGVYMEMLNGEYLSGETAILDQYDYDPYALCEAQKTLVGACYTYVPAFLALEMEYTDILASCHEAGTHTEACLAGTGAEAMKRNMYEPRGVFALCGALTDVSSQHSCMEGVASMYLNQTGSLEEGRLMCSGLASDHSEVCNSVIESRTDFFTPGV
jgi:hypothetical protein